MCPSGDGDAPSPIRLRALSRIGCPFHADAGWLHHDADAWVRCRHVDSAIKTGVRGIRGEVFLHCSAVTLDEADLSTSADHGQLDLWANECEGMCDV
jgi:hypothetical protein